MSSHQSNCWTGKARKTLFTLDSELECPTRRIFPRKKVKSNASKHFNKIQNCHPWPLHRKSTHLFPTCRTIYIGRRRGDKECLFHATLFVWVYIKLSLKQCLFDKALNFFRKSHMEGCFWPYPNKWKLRHSQISHTNESKACRCVPQQTGGGDMEGK